MMEDLNFAIAAGMFVPILLLMMTCVALLILFLELPCPGSMSYLPPLDYTQQDLDDLTSQIFIGHVHI